MYNLNDFSLILFVLILWQLIFLILSKHAPLPIDPEGFIIESISLTLCCYALAFGPTMAATSQIVGVEYCLQCPDWLKLFR